MKIFREQTWEQSPEDWSAYHLKPCPFCGGRPEINRTSIRCDDCRIEIRGGNFQNAMRRWNTRYSGEDYYE